jgi:hypothetical protein
MTDSGKAQAPKEPTNETLTKLRKANARVSLFRAKAKLDEAVRLLAVHPQLRESVGKVRDQVFEVFIAEEKKVQA